jgi:glycine cleavage system H protein
MQHLKLYSNRRTGMKEISELNFPDDVKYAEDHEWSKLEGGQVTIGICDYAQDQLGDVVFVELPQVGDTFDKGQEFGTVESVKAVSELIIPLGGEVTAVNEALEDTPELVNNEPYTGGWMIKIKPADMAEMDALMTKDAYLEMLKG